MVPAHTREGGANTPKPRKNQVLPFSMDIYYQGLPRKGEDANQMPVNMGTKTTKIERQMPD